MPPQQQRGRLGRIVVIGVYAVALGYLVIVGFASVIPQVFWPRSDESFDLSCEDGLRVLHQSLDRLRIDTMSTNIVDPKPLRSALEAWDLRINALRGRCDEDKVDLLDKYRYRVELNLQRYMREDAPLANRVAETLDATTPPTTPSNPTEPTP
ncbi:MAG: hypothetical protein AAF997_07650 [Myxococcota bacterium]